MASAPKAWGLTSWRCDAATAFLAPVRKRANLRVLTGVHVTRALIENGRAVGVEWTRDGRLQSARAASEVLLAAGALQSPQLLQLSGVGPAALPRRHRITVQSDQPEVGRGLQDHYQARVIVRLREKMSLNDQVRSPLALATMGAQWLFGQRGPLTVDAGQVGGMVCSPYATEGRPDVLFNVMPLSVDKPGDALHRRVLDACTGRTAARSPERGRRLDRRRGSAEPGAAHPLSGLRRHSGANRTLFGAPRSPPAAVTTRARAQVPKRTLCQRENALGSEKPSSRPTSDSECAPFSR
jgi:choline dehydrogenase-like flavoprotein